MKMKTKIIPLGSRIIVSINDQSQQTKSGIVLPCKTTGLRRKAFAIEVGPEVKHVKQGDEIVFMDYVTKKINIDEDEVIIFVEEYDVLGIVRR